MPLQGSLMVQGTTSDAGKSTLVVGLGRLLQRQGVNVAPFKPQNMALNSAVTVDGGEIGRAQALQALACKVEATTDMNPVLLKPTTDQGAQVIIHGKAVTNMKAKAYHEYKTTAWNAVADSYQRLKTRHSCILVEGAGSPAEINLRDRDIANMGFAERVDCPVILVADIDRGGVFAHLAGTLALLSKTEQDRVQGFIINRFRGDIALLEPGLRWLEEYTGKPVLGVLPYLHDLCLDAEDALSLSQHSTSGQEQPLKVVVPVLPRISNHTDFDPLRAHPQVDFHYASIDQPMPAADLLILPGSKNVMADLDALRTRGWETAIQRHLRYGGKVLGICGGYQMLGQEILDPDHIEGPTTHMPGLKLANLRTRLYPEKQLRQTKGTLQLPGQAPCAIRGYEIHAGVTEVADTETPLIQLSTGGYDGMISTDRQIMGTYLHGLFDAPEALKALLHWAGVESVSETDYEAQRESSINRLADCMAEHLDLPTLYSLIR